MTSKKEYKFLQFRVLIDERDSHQEKIEKEVQKYLDNGWELYNSHTSRGDTGRYLADVFIQILIKEKKNEENYLPSQQRGKCKDFNFYANGNLKKMVTYQADGVAKKSEDTYHENGKLKNMTDYQTDGVTKKSELTYDKYGKMKTDINETIKFKKRRRENGPKTKQTS